MRLPLFLLAFSVVACEAPVNQVIDLTPQTAALHLKGKHSSSPQEAIEILKQTPPLRDPILSRDLSKQYRWLTNEAEHGAWALEDRISRTQVFCHELCQCVSDRVLNWRNIGAIALSADLSIYQMMITSPTGMLHARAGDQSRVYHYHLATLFKSTNGSISVFDPILMPDAGLHPLSDLINRLEDAESLRYSIIRR